MDISAADRLGHLDVSPQGLAARDSMVYAASLALPAPRLVVTMGGGYSRPIGASVRAHADVFLQAAELAAE